MIRKAAKIILRNLLKNNPFYLQKVKDLISEIEPDKSIFLDYPVSLNQRYSLNKPHSHINEILKKDNLKYATNLEYFLQFKDDFLKIPVRNSERKTVKDPTWINGYIPGLDLISLYGFLVKFHPKLYLEVGSGNSTKIAKRAVEDYQLKTKICSIDPSPRSEINEICDQIVRKPLEDINLTIFNQLKEGDILFIDNSHRVLMNSDVTSVFLDIIPNLKSGVVVQIHDIFLPFDYPQSWADRFYSEQFMLANILIYGAEYLEILLPNFYISQLKELSGVLNTVWENSKMNGVERHGASFWFKKK